jgi:hypothetical protein
MPKEMIVRPKAGQIVTVNPEGDLKVAKVTTPKSKAYSQTLVEGTYVEPDPPPPPPQAELAYTTTIPAGAVLKGSVEWTATVTAGTAYKFEFLIDGVVHWPEFSEPWGGWLDTTKMTNGKHVLAVIGYDSAGPQDTIGGEVTVDNPPVIVIPPPPTGEDVLRVAPGDVLAAIRNPNINVIETSGRWVGGGIMSVDRSARPLTIRPAPGTRIDSVGRGDGGGQGAVFAMGYGGALKGVTLDGRPGGVGSASAWAFRDVNLWRAGIFEVYATEDVAFRYLTYENLGVDTGMLGGPTTSWVWYIGLGGTLSRRMVIDHQWFKHPRGDRVMGVAQVYAGGGGAAVDDFKMTNIEEMDSYSVGFTAWDARADNILLDRWKMNNVRGYYAGNSIYLHGSGHCSGTYKNIVATGSDGFGDDHTGGGVVVNGGGNVGI